ncbi:MAG: hypothetical protein LZF60_380037 [Nitrospira sp.]|nr:MAG: hypothetical protein LZF60_380037 [Nitrospira sp.]
MGDFMVYQGIPDSIYSRNMRRSPAAGMMSASGNPWKRDPA